MPLSGPMLPKPALAVTAPHLPYILGGKSCQKQVPDHFSPEQMYIPGSTVARVERLLLVGVENGEEA